MDGYLWMVANCLSTAAYVLVVKGLSNQSQLSREEPCKDDCLMFCFLCAWHTAVSHRSLSIAPRP